MMIDPDDDPEIQQLSIPIQPLIEELTCPICFNNIKDCYMTPCGHNFCSGCIYECVNRKHSCPCCNKVTVKDNLVKNHHFDRLATLVTFHKEESSRKYFESIINAKVPQPAQNDQNQQPNSPNPANQQRQLSPIEALFHKHMKRSLMSYEEYYRELQTQHRESVARVQTEYAKLMATAATNEKRDELMQECARKTQDHDDGFEKASDLLTSAYDSYLKEVAPAPASLPVAVTMTVPSKKFKFEGIVLKPSDLVKDARLILEAKMAERGAKIVAWSPANLLLLKKGTEEVILNEEWTVSQYRPPPGAEIAVMGEVQLMSDRPPECFTLTYNASNPQTCDYYTCRDCKFNWICKNCAENCHRGHTVSVYIIGHRSTWACCYCPKNNKCTIQHSKAKK